MRTSFPAALTALLLAACGPDLDFRQARHLEEAGDLHRAVAAYERFLADSPGDARVPEAAYRAGRLYAEALGRCGESAAHLERAARSGRSPWAGKALKALLSCPDYFPLRPGASWMYVDSLSQGENMRLELAVKSSSEGARGEIAGAYFAGENRFKDYRRRYEKADWSVWEEAEGGGRVPILRFPFRAGNAWTARRGGRRVRYRIEKDGLQVRVKAGRFSGCLKVREHTEGFESWVYDYYCPGVGRVKTAVGIPGRENPNTELARFSSK